MKETLKPIFVLTGICLIVAVLLAATNGITAPIIAANAERPSRRGWSCCPKRTILKLCRWRQKA